MVKRILAGIAALCLCMSTAFAAQRTMWNDEMPPERFRGGVNSVGVIFAPPEVVSKLCGKGMPPVPAGMQIMACTYVTRHGEVTILPDPCDYGDKEYYAKLVCHERAHQQGWPAMHGN